jgi:hypothetical protein
MTAAVTAAALIAGAIVVAVVWDQLEERRDRRIIAEADAAYRADCAARIAKFNEWHPSSGWRLPGEES